jgi:peptidoglycan/LPS O-acetylase OafA/YrhL
MVYRPDIDGLRAVAVVPVVLYHAGMPGVAGGFVGVDVFFVISGFLITGILHDDLATGRFSLVGFYERRARRILPALIAVILACFIGAATLARPLFFAQFAKSAAATALFGSNIWFWRDSLDYFASAAAFQPLLHTWSLAVEEQFYIVFPLLLWALFPRPRPVLTGIVIAGCFLSFSLAIWGTSANPAAAFYLAPTRAWELGLGVLLALGVVPKCQRSWAREGAAAAGIAAILAAVVLYEPDTPFPGFAALLPCVGAAALIWSGIQGPTRTGALLSTQPVVFVGLISYSLYLWHWPILAFLRLYSGVLIQPGKVAAAAVAASFVLAAASWIFVERPFRRRPPAGFGRSAIFAVSLTGLTFVVLLAAGIWSTGGLPQRLSPEMKIVMSEAEENPDRGEGCLGRMPELGLCRFGATANGEAADFLLWGDSHALAVLPGIDVAAHKAGRSGLFAGKLACPPLLGLDRAGAGPDHNCVGFNAAVMEELKNRNDLPLVILEARWALAAEGYRAPGEPGKPVLLERAETEPTPKDPSGNFALFRAGLDKTVTAILGTGRKVILLGGVPEIGWNVPDELFRHLRWGVPLSAPPTRNEVTRRNDRADLVLTGLAERQGVRLLQIAPLLCNPVCRVEEDGRPLYSDDDHLSRFGATTLVGPLFLEKVWPKAALGSPQALVSQKEITN